MIVGDIMVEKAHTAYLNSKGGIRGIRAALEAVTRIFESQAVAVNAVVFEEQLRGFIKDNVDDNGMVAADLLITTISSYVTTSQNKARLETGRLKTVRDKTFE